MKIVFTDFMILLVSVLIGLNSTMSFSNEKKLPPMKLPKTSTANETGLTSVKNSFISIRTNNNGKVYYYNNKKVSINRLFEIIKKNRVSSVVIRADEKENFKWNDLCGFTSKLMKAGVKEISYGTRS